VSDKKRSLKLARESSGKGSRYGQYVLGKLYVDAVKGGVEEDCAQAVALYRLAAAHNFDEAQNSLGFMYEEGYGVEQSFAEALRFYQLAAAQGHPAALFSVAGYHEHGDQGVRQNIAEAIRWYKRAQSAGNTDAAFALRRCRN
jgi:TPR repeat protein